jgi:hypothetical protein
MQLLIDAISKYGKAKIRDNLELLQFEKSCYEILLGLKFVDEPQPLDKGAEPFKLNLIEIQSTTDALALLTQFVRAHNYFRRFFIKSPKQFQVQMAKLEAFAVLGRTLTDSEVEEQIKPREESNALFNRLSSDFSQDEMATTYYHIVLGVDQVEAALKVQRCRTKKK